jgi:peptidoglycan/xylan/chitin deacetylase (PgdA/CDA1 family)
MNAIAEALSGIEPEFRAGGRRCARAVAQAVLPASVVAWRAPEARQQSKKKAARVALTFDDGPTPLTLDYLTVLERLGAHATFFVIGEQCARHPDIVAEIAARGHELCGHGYTHRRFTELSGDELSDELERTQALLPPSVRKRAFVRPPHGAVSLRSMVTCARRGFTTVLWSLNSNDWRNKETSQVEAAFRERTPEAGEIVLLHDGQTWTMNALPTIVGALEKAGHELCTVGELLG